MRGFWADERVEGGIWPKKNLIFSWVYRYFKQKEIEFLTEADYTISLTEAARKEIHGWKTIANNPIPIEVIPCCADLELFNPNSVKPSETIKLREALGIASDSFVLLYVGSVGTWYMLEEMLDFFKVLLENKPNAVFLIVTKDQPEPMWETVRQKGINPGSVVITRAERHQMPLHISVAQLAIFFIKPVFSKKASSPTKQGEIMGMGIPIICNDGVGDTAEIIQQTGAGAVIADFNRANYLEICRNLKDIMAILPATVSKAAEQHFSLTAGLEKYSRVYEFA